MEQLATENVNQKSAIKDHILECIACSNLDSLLVNNSNFEKCVNLNMMQKSMKRY